MKIETSAPVVEYFMPPPSPIKILAPKILSCLQAWEEDTHSARICKLKRVIKLL